MGYTGYLRFMSLSLLCLLLTSCTPVADPRQGGLFGYSPEDYERRIKEREQRLDQVQIEGQEQQTQQSALQAEIKDTEAERNRLQANLHNFDSDLAKLRSSLKSRNLQSTAAQQKQQALDNELKALSKSSWKTSRQLEGGDVQGKEKEIAQLRAKLAELTKEAEILGQL
jgi:septal ring factor EnvC (AmiA/AmiB activator)